MSVRFRRNSGRENPCVEGYWWSLFELFLDVLSEERHSHKANLASSPQVKILSADSFRFSEVPSFGRVSCRITQATNSTSRNSTGADGVEVNQPWLECGPFLVSRTR